MNISFVKKKVDQMKGALKQKYKEKLKIKCFKSESVDIKQ
jgi:hypothetical protein